MSCKKRKRIFISLSAGIIVFCIVSIIFIIKNNAYVRINDENISADQEIYTGELVNETYEYAYETSYSGNPHLHSQLFAYPFQKSDSYICNRDYIQKIGVEQANILCENAKDSIELVFNYAYKEQNEERIEQLQNNLSSGMSIVYDTGAVAYGNEEIANGIFQWLKEKKVSMEGEFITDKCLVYYDFYNEIVRGQLLLTIFECDDLDVLSKELKIDHMELGKEYSIVMEVKFNHTTTLEDRTFEKICDVNVI